MKLNNVMALLACVMLLGACTAFKTHSEIEALNEAQAVGSPFTQHLADEYRIYANAESDRFMDYPDALHFARKGLAAAKGEEVLPEPLADWDLLVSDMNILAIERARLINVFDVGAREIAPKESAIAQARFDCWVENEEEKWAERKDSNCRNEFLQAIANLERLVEPTLQEKAPPPPVTPVRPIASEPMQPRDAVYLVFFDFDQSTIEGGAQSVLDAVAEEVNSRSLSAVNIQGHTDRAGSNSYNDRLAMRRANAVRKALISRGVDESLLKVSGRGETEPLVQTNDGIREPANRRAQITFE